MVALHGLDFSMEEGEFVSIDERGMIQLPRDLMIESGIDGHARVKVVPEGLLIEKEDPGGT